MNSDDENNRTNRRIETFDESSDDIFGDDNDAQDSQCAANCTFRTADNNDSFLNAFETPTLKFPPDTGTPSYAAVPGIPLSLAPFLSNTNEPWTTDLETPQAKENDNKRSRVSASLEPLGNFEGREGVRVEARDDPLTPVNAAVSSLGAESVYTSPVLATKKRKRPKRRILESSVTTASLTGSQIDRTVGTGLAIDSVSSDSGNFKANDDSSFRNAEKYTDGQQFDVTFNVSDKGVDQNTTLDATDGRIKGTKLCVSDNLSQCSDKVRSSPNPIHNPGACRKGNDSENEGRTLETAASSCADRTVNSWSFGPGNENEKPTNSAKTSESQDFFSNLSFTAIDQLCVNEAEKGNEKSLNVVTKNDLKTRTNVKQVDEIEIDDSRKRTTSNEAEHSTVEISRSRRSFNGSPESIASPNYKCFGDRVRDIKRVQKSRDRSLRCKDANIALEEFTKDAIALENAVILPTIRNDNKSSIQSKSELGFVPFTQFCSLERGKTDDTTDNTDKPKINYMEAMQSGSNEIDQSETKVALLISEKSNLSNVLGYDGRPRRSSSLSEEPPDSSTNKFDPPVNNQSSFAIVLNGFDPQPKNKDVSQSGAFSIEKEESRYKDLFKEADGENITDTQMWRLGETAEMAIKITDDIEEFSEWNYIPEEQSQEIAEKSVQSLIEERSTEPSLKTNDSCRSTENLQCGFSTAGGRSLSISKTKLERAQKLFEEIDNPATENLVNATSSITSGKDMSLSSNQMKRATKLLGDNSTVIAKENTSLKGFSNAICKSMIGERRGLKRKYEDDTDKINLKRMNCFEGFITARGAVLVASEKAMKKAAAMFENEDVRKIPISMNDSLPSRKASPIHELSNKIEFDGKQDSNQFHGFSLEDIRKSDDCKTKAELVFQNNVELKALIDSWGFCGFSKAEIATSEAYLNKAILLFQNDFELESLMDPWEFNGFSKADIATSEAYLKEAKPLFQNYVEEKSPIQERSLKNSPPAETRLNEAFIDEAKTVDYRSYDLTEVQEMKRSICGKSENPSTKAESASKISITEKTLVPNNSQFLDESDASKIKSSFAGFSTASGKTVRVSETSLKRSKLLFKDERLTDDNKKMNQPLETSTSERASAWNNDSFVDQTENSTFQMKRCSHVGFSTASGKTVKVSDKALSKARTFFIEENVNPNLSPLEAKTFFSNDLEIPAAASYSAISSRTSSDSTSLSGTVSSSSKSTPGLKSAMKRKHEDENDETPSGRSMSPKSKSVRFNELQARKLFIMEAESDEEYLVLKNYGGNEDRSSVGEDAKASTVSREECREADAMGEHDRVTCRSPYRSAPNEEYRYDSKGTDSSDRMIPKEPEPCIEMPSVSDEVFASAVALLADEEHSNDANSWSSGFASSPSPASALGDRPINAEPIMVDETGATLKPIPSSPIIGIGSRSQRRLRRSRTKASAKARVMTVIREEDNGSSSSLDCMGIGDISSDSHRKLDRDVKSSDGPRSDLTDPSGEGVDNAKISVTCDIESKGCSSRTFEVPDKNSSLVSAMASTGNGTSLLSVNPSVIHSEQVLVSNRSDLDAPILENCDESSRTEAWLEERLAASLEQDKIIRAKKKNRPRPIKGGLLQRRVAGESRITWKQAAKGSPPVPYTAQELAHRGIGRDVLEVTARTAKSYKFRCAEFYSQSVFCSSNCGLEVGDGARLIVDENGFAGISEFHRAFLASAGVDPTLVPPGWVENHYKWIVWKLASMDRMKFVDVDMPRMLTPHRVMEQLKYRYDREIDGSQRPALRRILEKDDPASRRMVLCVAAITKLDNNEDKANSINVSMTRQWKMEVTDGWYGVVASIDMAMVNHIENGRVREGTKLITCGAELINGDQGCSPLEIPADVSLKIHTNSTRRARWFAKLGYQPCPGPIPTSLEVVHENGGHIGKLTTIISRVYPILYHERYADGGSIFRNAKSEEKVAAAYEQDRQSRAEVIYSEARSELEAKKQKRSSSSRSSDSLDSAEILDEQWNQAADVSSFEAGLTEAQRKSLLDHRRALEEQFQRDVESRLLQNLPPPRKVSPLLRVRVVEGEKTATLTVWVPSEEVLDILREGNRVSIHKAYASGRRSGELQLTAGSQSFFNREVSKDDPCPRRCCTLLSEVAAAGFNPPYSEFDTVGIVVSIGTAPHGMRNFEAANLAYPGPDLSTSSYLSVLFWDGIAAHGYTEILSVGSCVSCSNLQWRRSVPRVVPIAYFTEKTVFTRNPRQQHLRVSLDHLKKQVRDLKGYAAKCAEEIATAVLVKKSASSGSPAPVTPNKLSPFPANRTPGRSPQVTPGNPTGVTPVKSMAQRRLEKLNWYGAPPDLSPITVRTSKSAAKQFQTPAKKTLN